jgi:hypothetical protein
MTPITAQDYLLVAKRAQGQARQMASQIADTRNHRASLCDALDALDAQRAQELTTADAHRARMAALDEALASATISARLFEDTPAEAETAAKVNALQDEQAELTAKVMAYEATAAEREAAYVARRHELTDAQAACDTTLATLEATRDDVVDAGTRAFAAAGEALALARVSEITTLQARLRALDDEAWAARLDLRTAQNTIADDLSSWPDLADRLAEQYGAPIPTDDARTAMLTAWRAFLHTLPTFAKADHTPVELEPGGAKATYFQCVAVPERFMPLLLGYPTSIMGAQSPDDQRDSIIREKLQITERALTALRAEIAYAQRASRRRRR